MQLSELSDCKSLILCRKINQVRNATKKLNQVSFFLQHRNRALFFDLYMFSKKTLYTQLSNSTKAGSGVPAIPCRTPVGLSFNNDINKDTNSKSLFVSCQLFCRHTCDWQAFSAARRNLPSAVQYSHAPGLVHCCPLPALTSPSLRTRYLRYTSCCH